LRHISVNMCSCEVYCELYCDFILFHLIINQKRCIIFWIWIQVILRCRMQTIKSVLSGIEKCNLYFPVKFSLKYIIQFLYDFLYFSFPTLRLYTILCPSEKCPWVIFIAYYNKHNQHSLSLTTLTPSAVLPTPIQLYYLQQLSALPSVPQFTIQKTVDCNNLQWMIENVADTLMSKIITGWFQSTEDKIFSSCNSFSLHHFHISTLDYIRKSAQTQWQNSILATLVSVAERVNV
jgi:hypothetical protein